MTKGGQAVSRAETIRKIEEIAQRVCASEGLEVFEIELKGSGRAQMLRVVIDKLSGVTHADCEFVSQQVGTILDVEDLIPGSYQLEVSSPGVERKLRKWEDWERFAGQKAKVVLREPVDSYKSFDGVITSAADQTITIEVTGGRTVTFPYANVDRANLKFEW